ncbi:MAG: glycoside hydrolase family 127 protein, partial [Clostridia bacterium]
IAAGLSGHERAWTMLRRWQDWFNHCPDLPVIKYTNLAFQGIVASTYMLQTPVGKWDDIEVARKYYEEDWRLAQFMQKERDCIHRRFQPGYEPHPHGTEIESLVGYLDLYRATGAPYYLKAVLGARDLYKQDWQHPGGGIVMCEFLDAFPGCGWISNRYPYNELCCSAFWINLNQRLHRLFPDIEEYVGEIEKSIYNIAIANQDDDRAIRYFAHMEGTKDVGGTVTCCCGVGTRLFGMLPEYLYSISEDALYVDIYASSEIEWAREAGCVTVEVQTNMPLDGKVHIVLHLKKACSFTLALRMPGWMSDDAKVFVNGAQVAVGTKGNYLKLMRTWAEGDAVSFELPMAFRFTKYNGKEQIELFERYSFERGPMLYAVSGELTNFQTTWVQHCPLHVNEWALPTKDPQTFDIAGDPAHKLVPYYLLDDKTPMTCFPIFTIPGYGYR